MAKGIYQLLLTSVTLLYLFLLFISYIVFSSVHFLTPLVVTSLFVAVACWVHYPPPCVDSLFLPHPPLCTFFHFFLFLSPLCSPCVVFFLFFFLPPPVCLFLFLCIYIFPIYSFPPMCSFFLSSFEKGIKIDKSNILSLVFYKMNVFSG